MKPPLSIITPPATFEENHRRLEEIKAKLRKMDWKFQPNSNRTPEEAAHLNNLLYPKGTQK